MTHHSTFRLASVAVWAIVLLLAVNALRLGFASTTAPPPESFTLQQEVSAVPHTIDLKSVRRNPDGSVAAELGGRLSAVMSDGSHVSRYEVAGRRTSVQRLIRLASGRAMVTDDLKQLVAVVKAAVDVGGLLRDPASQCMKSFRGRQISGNEILSGTEQVLGYDTVRITNRGADTWYAPSLGCAELRFRNGAIERLAALIVKGDPDPAIFGVPSTFRMVSIEELSGRK